MIDMTFYLVSHVMPKCLLDDLCATHPMISVDHWAHDRQYRHVVHKNQVVRTTNRSPLQAIVHIRTHPSQSVITTKWVFTLFLFFYISNTTLEPSDSPSPYKGTDNVTVASVEGETAGNGNDGWNGGEGDSRWNTAKNIIWEDMYVRSSVLHVVKTGSPQVLLGGPEGQGTRVEVIPDTSRAWATTEVDLGAYGQSLEHGKVVRSLWSISKARTSPQRPGIVQGVLALSLGWTWLSPLVRVQDLLGAGGGPKGTDRVRPENKMDLGHSGQYRERSILFKI